jgi:hypothetical protein
LLSRNWASAASRARAERRTRKIESQRNHHTGAGDGDARGDLLTTIGDDIARHEQTLFLRLHRQRYFADRAAAVFRGCLADQRDRVGGLVLLDEVHFPRELLEPAVGRGSHLPDVFHLGRIVARRPREFVNRGDDGRDGSLVIPEEFRSQGQQIAACGALGPADFQQHRVDLIFHLNGVHHQAAGFPGLIDEDHRRRADRHQYQKSRREQQDLPNRAAARGIKRHQCLTQRNSVVPRAGKVPSRTKRPYGQLVPATVWERITAQLLAWPARYCSSQWI